MSSIGRTASLIFLTAALPAITWAHSSLPDADWCRPGRIAVVAHVTFSLAEVENYQACQPATACEVPASGGLALGRSSETVPEEHCLITQQPDDSCGEFDDDYSLVRRLTDAFCQGFQLDPSGQHVPSWGTVVADVIPPNATNANQAELLFYDEFQHHQYVLGQQVELMCLRCEDPPAEPTE